MPPRELLRFALVISLQQGYARARRSIAAFAGIAGGIVLVLIQLGFQSALYESSVRLHHVLDGQLVVVAEEFRSIQDPTWFPREWLVMVRAHPAVMSVAPLYLSPITVRNIDDHTARTLLGIGIELDQPALTLQPLGADVDGLRLPGRILFDEKSQPSYGDVVGKLRRSRTVDMQTASVSAPLQVPLTVIGTHSLGGTIVYFGTALMSAQTLSNTTGQPLHRVNIGVVKLRPGSDPARVESELKTLLPAGAVAMTADEFVQLEKRFWRNETPIGFLFDVGAAIGFLISAIYVYQVLFQIIEENLPEYAVFKTMGYPAYFFTILVVCTAVMLAFAALLPAVLVSSIVYKICVTATMLDLKLTANRVVGVAALALLTAVASGWLAQRRLNDVDLATLL